MSLVAVVKTSPPTFNDDVKRVMELAEFANVLDAEKKTVIKLNLSWSKFFPSCSTHPYTFNGVVKTLIDSGYSNQDLIATENRTVVTNITKGIQANRWASTLEKYKVPFLPLTRAKWVEVQPKRKTYVLERMFGPITIPEVVLDSNILQLPTIKTHGHTFMTGALKNAFGLLLQKLRHHAHPVIHEILVDLLLIQKEFCANLFCVTDGTIIGDGPGPRTMIPKTGNLLLASADMVGIDTVQSEIMGIDPFKVKKLVYAQKRELGVMDPAKIELVGDYSSHDKLPVTKTSTGRSPVIYFDQKFRSGIFAPLFHTSLMNIPILASLIYHDYFWYPLIGKGYVKEFLERSEWGELFQQF
ncbi:MAG: DUF362 domain-containing protein [Promethearchaeota archaeon]